MSGPVDRRVAPVIATDVAAKMVLLSGPRQCGKTTLVRQLIGVP
jgi:predicted AAA+ superfamily ATPase